MTHSVSVANAHLLMPFVEIISVYLEHHIEHSSSVQTVGCIQNTVFECSNRRYSNHNALKSHVYFIISQKVGSGVTVSKFFF
jgi:hypothetical protein